MVQQETIRVMHLAKAGHGQQVLADINFSIGRGEIIGIIGLQNTGKQLLADILSGAQRPDAGTVFLEGQPFRCSSILQAQQAGIFFMSQEPQCVPDMTVAMNLFLLCAKNRRRALFSPRKILAEAAVILERFHLDIRPAAHAASLSPMELRLLDLVRIAIQNPKLVILSNIPLTDDNVKDPRFLHLVEQLQQQGLSFLFIGNKLSNAILLSARVYLLQEGLLSVGIPQEALNLENTYRLLTGGDHWPPAVQPQESAGPEVFRLCAKSGGPALLSLHAGEILGLVWDALPYKDPDASMELFTSSLSRYSLYVQNKAVRWKSLRSILRSGAAVIPDLDTGNGVFENLSLCENLSFVMQSSLANPLGLINRRRCQYTAAQSAAFLELPVPSPDLPLGRKPLPTETAKKLQIGRWLWKRPPLYIFFNPFTALDEKGFEKLRCLMTRLARQGAGLLILSSDYHKLYNLCDSVRIFPPLPDLPKI